MKRRTETSGEKSSLHSAGMAIACSLTLLATLAVFPTSLNPGLPLTIGGTLAVLTALYRAIAGSGRHFRLESELITVLLVWLAVCSLFTLDEYLSQRSLATFVGGVAFLFAAQVGIKSRRHWRGMVYSLVAACTLASIHAWVPALYLARQTGTLSPLKGTFNNPDTFSILPLIALCLVLGLVEKASVWGTVVNLTLAGFLLMTVFATGCRGSMLGFFLGGGFFVGSLFYYQRKKAEKTQLFVGFPILLTLFAIPLVGYKFSFSSKWTRILETNAAEMESIRLELLQNGWKAIIQNPLFGSGPGTFGLSYQTVRPPDHNFMYINIAHNDFLEMGTEAGIIGLLLWSALTYFSISIPLHFVTRGRRPTEAAAIAGAVVALTTYSLFNFIIVQRPVFWAQCWLFGLALSFPSSRYKSKEKPATRLTSSAILLVAGLWSAYVGFQSIQADALYVQAQQAEARLELEEASQLYQQAATLEPPRVDGGLARVANLEKIRLFQGVDNLSEQLEVLQQLTKASPNSVPVLLRLAEAQQSAGSPEEAKVTLSRARELTPHKSEVFEAELVLLLSTNDLEGAAKSLAQYTPKHWDQTKDQFEKVLFTLAVEKPNSAREIALEWLKQNTGEKGRNLIQDTAIRARSNKEWIAEKTLLHCLVTTEPNNLCWKVQLATATGNLEGAAQELVLLSEFKQAAKEQLAPCYSDLLSRWSVLTMKEGRVEEVLTTLADYLKISPDQSWARAQLAEIMADQGQPAKAAKLLRLGLERRPNDAVLVLSLAHIFEKQGSNELALNYYREVARLDPKNGEAKSKIAKLMKRR